MVNNFLDLFVNFAFTTPVIAINSDLKKTSQKTPNNNSYLYIVFLLFDGIQDGSMCRNADH